MRDTNRRTFNQWRTSLIKKYGVDKGVSLKMKARLLVSSFKPTHKMSDKDAFFKWLVHANLTYPRKAIEKFALFRRLNLNTSFWRFKSLLFHRKQKGI